MFSSSVLLHRFVSKRRSEDNNDLEYQWANQRGMHGIALASDVWCNGAILSYHNCCQNVEWQDVRWQESSHCIALWLCKLNDHHMHNYNHYLHKLSSRNTTLCLILMLHCITNVNGSGSCREKPSFFIICHGLPFPSSYKSCKNHNYFTMRSNIDDWLWLARRVTI